MLCPGESKIANEIAGNIYFTLRTKLNEQLHKIYMHDVRLIVREGHTYRYPDIMVAPASDQSDTHAVTQPVLIIEITSDQSVSIDRKDKLFEYKNIPSVQHYLIIDQSQYAVELYSREKEKMVLRSLCPSRRKHLSPRP